MRGRGHIFDNRRTLSEMLQLRMEGKGPSELGARYGCDHTTIIYHCKRAGVQVPGVRGMIIVSSGVIFSPQQVAKEKARVVVSRGVAMVRVDYDGSPINPGRDYAEYLEIQRQRKDILFQKTNGIKK